MADAKLDPYRELVEAGELDDEAIAEIAETTPAEVAAYRESLKKPAKKTSTRSRSRSKSTPKKTTTSTTTRSKSRSKPTNRADRLREMLNEQETPTLRLTELFHYPIISTRTGKRTAMPAQRSVYRGRMAFRILDIAEENDKLDYVHVVAPDGEPAQE